VYEQSAYIIGIGSSRAFGFDLGSSPLRLQTEALAAALADAGLAKDEIDGIATSHGSPSGVDYDEFVTSAGLDISWASQSWSHGRWAATVLSGVALAIDAGLASCVAVVDTQTTRRGYVRHLGGLGGGHTKEGLRDCGGGHGEWDIHGLDTPGAATALVAQAYFDRYGATPDDLATIAVTFREHANKNPMAVMRDKILTRDDYFAEPPIAGPFRRADYCLSSEGSVCLIVARDDRARDGSRPPVVIAGMDGVHGSREDFALFGRPGLPIAPGFPLDADRLGRARPAVYAMAGVARDDIDGLYMYDSFSSNLWMVLERFGFCKEGEAPAYVRDVGIGLSSRMPVNTNGGLMSEAHLSGYGHLIEMVRQLRGDAGQRQIAGVRTLQWATPRGDSIVLRAA
jgi:acetyl-CoA acetyltransferase